MLKNYKNYTSKLNSWQLEIIYFKNLYENKFRNFYSNFSPFAFYDNVKNAIKFSDEGSIEFGYEKKGNNLEFFVKDTGIIL